MSSVSESERLNVCRTGARYGLQVTGIDRCEGGFSTSRVYRVTVADGRRLAFRCTPASDSAAAARTQRLHQFLVFLEDRGISQVAPPLLPAGQTHQRTVRLGTDDWQVEPWKPGVPLQGNNLSEDCLASAAELLQRFSAVAVNFARSVPNAWLQVHDGPSPAIQRRLELVDDLLKTQLSRLMSAAQARPSTEFGSLVLRMCQLLQHSLPNLRRSLIETRGLRFALQPVIRDLWRAHVLFTDHAVTGLIDLTACSTDHPAVDLVRLQRSWFGSCNERVAAWIFRIEEARGRRWDPDELRLLADLDEAAVMLSPVVWMQRWLQDQESVRHPSIMARMHELVGLAESFERLQIGGASSRLWFPHQRS